jgi:D-alanine-D-alanine ligase
MARKKLKIALIFGGTSQEREVSLVSGKNILKNLDQKKYQITPIEVTLNNSWIKKNLNKLLSADVAFLALHGPGGEDGTIQGVLESLRIKYTGSGVLASALAMDKAKTKRMVASIGVLVAPHIVISKSDYSHDPSKYLKKIKGTIVIKPNRIGSSLGVTITSKKEEIKRGLISAFEHDEEIIIEPYIQGRELTVPVLGNSTLEALPVIEIIPKRGSTFFDFRAIYNSNFSDEIVPAPIPKILAEKLQMIAMEVHELLGCRGVTRSDFIVTGKGQIYFLEINTIPGMTENSLVPKSAKAVGISYPKLLDKIIQLAINKE